MGTSTVDVSEFERAVDAVVAGDMPALAQLLATRPGLVNERSVREHHATLLHYVSANGVEGERQRTPPNVLDVARTLLDAGAEVDAEAEMYDGRWTTLGLVVTSCHPRDAGVQISLAELLLERGARVDSGTVCSCLANGCPEAAAYMAERGAPLDLEGAAGLGRVDAVAEQFAASPVAPEDAGKALIMAAWYGQLEVIAWLLDHGVGVASRHPRYGSTALHVAAYNGHPALVELLLGRGAPAAATDAVHGTTPRVWALHRWQVEQRGDPAHYAEIVRILEAAETDPS